MSDDTYDNGTHEKHHPCRVCGKYASERHENGWLAQPPPGAKPTKYPDGSTGQWTCRRCTLIAIRCAYVSLVLDNLFDDDENNADVAHDAPGTGDLFGGP